MKEILVKENGAFDVLTHSIANSITLSKIDKEHTGNSKFQYKI